MGASEFIVTIPIEDYPAPEIAFQQARDDAFWENGHGGYTGTIAEKPGFVLFDVDCSMSIDEFVDALASSRPGKVLDEVYEMAGEVYGHGDRIVEIYNDKWGPAVCFELEGRWVFCGLASC